MAAMRGLARMVTNSPGPSYASSQSGWVCEKRHARVRERPSAEGSGMVVWPRRGVLVLLVEVEMDL